MAKLKITILEGTSLGVTLEAQFNPKEIGVDKSIPWQAQHGKGPGALIYVQSESRTMQCELFFDGFSTGTSIQGELDKLEKMTDIDGALKRPPKVSAMWGAEGVSGLMPKFTGVLESVSVKYTMFDPDGKPLRAACGLKFIEAKSVMVGKPPASTRTRQGKQP